MLLDLGGDEARLALGVHRLVVADQRARWVSCPESLILALRVVSDDRVGSVQNGLGRTIVLLKLDYFGFREVFLEVQDVRDVCSAPAIHTLTFVTHYTYILLFLSQEIDEGELESVGVLILIYEDVAEAFVVVGADIFALAE